MNRRFIADTWVDPTNTRITRPVVVDTATGKIVRKYPAQYRGRAMLEAARRNRALREDGE